MSGDVEPETLEAPESSATAAGNDAPLSEAQKRERVKKRRRVLKRGEKWWEKRWVRLLALVVSLIIAAAVMTKVGEWWVERPEPELDNPDAQ